MATDTLDPTVDSVLSKLADLTVQLEGSEQATLGSLVMAGLNAADGEASDGASTGGEPSEVDVKAIADKVYALRESMSTDEQAVLDTIVLNALGAPEPEVKGHAWYTLFSITAPRGMGTVYSNYCKQFNANYGGRWSSTSYSQYTAHSYSVMSTYTCWGWG